MPSAPTRRTRPSASTGKPAAQPRATSASVVLYDAGSQSREVLTFGFEREDFEVFPTDRAEEAALLMRASSAPILVVSVGTDAAARAEALSFIGALRDEEAHKGVAVVALGRRDLREEVLRAGADEFVSWPAFIRDAVTLARLALAARVEQGAGLVGLLEDYEVYFLVRALAAASRSAVIELERGGRKAFLHMARGTVVAARVGRLSGVAAFHHLLLWSEASLRLRFVSPPGERKIDAPMEDLLQTGVKFVTDFETLASRVGGPQAMFEQRPDRLKEPSIKVPAEVRRFAEAVPTGATLVDLVESSPFKPFDTIKVCYRLCELGLIGRRDPVRSISPLTAQLAVRDWLLGTTSTQPRATVTEAGRRAAEAYAEAAAARARGEAAPSDELFAPRPADPLEPVPVSVVAAKSRRTQATNGAPAAPLEDAPTSPREAPRGPSARNKSKGREARKETRFAPFAPTTAEAAEAATSAHATPVSLADEPEPREPVFDEVDEAFFAQEAELHRVEPVENFADLDETGRKRRLAEKGKWSLFGDKPAPKSGPSKKKR